MAPIIREPNEESEAISIVTAEPSEQLQAIPTETANKKQ